MGETDKQEVQGMEPLDDIFVCESGAGDYDGADIRFSFNGTLLSISFFPSPSAQDGHPPGFEDHVVDLITRGISVKASDDETEEMYDRVLTIILEAGRSILREATAGKMPSAGWDDDHRGQSVHFRLYPETLTFRLIDGPDGKPTLVPISPENAYTRPLLDGPRCVGFEDAEYETDETLPRYSTKNVIILESFLRSAGKVIARVQVESGQDMFCKAYNDPVTSVGSPFKRELERLLAIGRIYQCHQPGHAHTTTAAAIRVPELLGYVEHTGSGGIVGLLRRWIAGKRLSDVDVAGAAVERRCKWAAQIRETIHQLHAADLIWGDGKPQNIIIDDEEDGAWLIDFGGGYTKTWVDEALANTAEGDKQALGRILKFLGVDEDF